MNKQGLIKGITSEPMGDIEKMLAVKFAVSRLKIDMTCTGTKHLYISDPGSTIKTKEIEDRGYIKMYQNKNLYLFTYYY